MTFELRFAETGLASRQAAASARELVEENLRAGQTVLIDLSLVLNISSSYADELFGVLVERRSLGEVTSTIRLQGAAPTVLRQIATAIQYRLDRRSTENGVSAAVLATRELEKKKQLRAEFA